MTRFIDFGGTKISLVKPGEKIMDHYSLCKIQNCDSFVVEANRIGPIMDV